MKSLHQMRLLWHALMMASSSDNQTTGSADKMTINPHIRIAPTSKNPRGYSLFDMQHVLNYMNNQIIYYYMIGAILAAKLTCFHQLMKQWKVSLKLIKWDGTSNHASNKEDIPENIIPPCNHNNSDLDYSTSLSKAIDIKISPSIIIQLKYDSTMTQYSNWLIDLKTIFNINPAKFSISY